MRNLVIGNSSQLGMFFPESYLKISSRLIQDSIFDETWNIVYICFSEQKTYIVKDDSFLDINYHYTINIINRLKAKKIVYFSTAELWNNLSGPINDSLNFDYHYSDYIFSKQKITEYLLKSDLNIKIVYPFNFNSIYRKPPFLFGKIFDSIVYSKKINIGDTYYYRDLVHPKFIVDNSIDIESNLVLGSGRVIFVNDFIRKLYDNFDMDFNEFVSEDISSKSFYRENVFYSEQNNVLFESQLLELLCKEINQVKSKIK